MKLIEEMIVKRNNYKENLVIRSNSS